MIFSIMLVYWFVRGKINWEKGFLDFPSEIVEQVADS